MTDRTESPEATPQYRTEPAPGGASYIVHVSTNRRCRAESETVARMVVACLEAGEYFLAQRLLRARVPDAVAPGDREGGAPDPGPPWSRPGYAPAEHPSSEMPAETRRATDRGRGPARQ